MATGRLTVTLLGGLQVLLVSGEVVNLPTRKAEALLAYLASRPGQAHPRAKLAALLWGDMGEEQAQNNVRQTLFALRKSLPDTNPPPLVIEGKTLALNPAAADVDVATFERWLAEGTPEALERAAALYQGDLLEGLDVHEEPFEEWLLVERERLRELALEAFAKLLAHQSKGGPSRPGMTERAVQTAVRLLGLDPLQEAVHRALMRLYARQGRRGAALKQYQVCVEVLRRELGTEPEEETRQLYREILHHEPARATPPGADVRPSARRVRQHRARHDRMPSRTLFPEPETPLIGREMEVALLRQAVDAAWHGRGRVVMIRGEAGIGKSRLAEEVAREWGQRGGLVLVGRAYETVQILPFGPWVDALRVGQVVEEPALLEALHPAGRVELARLFPELEGPGLGLPPVPEDSVRLFEAMAHLLEWLVAQRPLALILEDLHWADEMSLRFLFFLARRIQERPVLLVGTAREEELAGASILRQLVGDLDRDRRLLSCALSSLLPAESVRLVRALAGPSSDPTWLAALAEEVWSLCKGNPFMIVETIRSIQEGGRPQTPTAVRLPQRVRDVIAGRLDRLTARGQALVEVAAAIGDEFDFAVLQQAAGLGEREAAEAMEELVRRRILQGAGDHFDFSHERLREVAYERLLVPKRRVLHAAVARALEQMYPGRLGAISDRLAHHYSKAEDADKAVIHLTGFSEQATQRYALDEAVRALREAMAFAQRLPADRQDVRLLDLTVRLARALYFLGRFPEALAALQEQGERVERLDAPTVRGPYFFWLGHVSPMLGEHSLAVQAGERALQEATRCGDDGTMGQALYSLAREGYWSGNILQGLEQAKQAVALLERAGERPWLVRALWVLGLNYAAAGDFQPALEAEGRAHALAETLGDFRLQGMVASHTGWIHTQRGEYDAAIEACRRSLDNPDRLNSALGFGYLGAAFLEGGEPDQALAALEECVSRLGELKVRRSVGRFMICLAESHLVKGDTGRARRLAAEGLELATASTHRYAMGCGRRALGRIARADGNLEEAATHLADALGTFGAIGARYEVARTHLDLAALAHARRDEDMALTHLREARELFALLKVPRFCDRTHQLARDLGIVLA